MVCIRVSLSITRRVILYYSYSRYPFLSAQPLRELCCPGGQPVCVWTPSTRTVSCWRLSPARLRCRITRKVVTSGAAPPCYRLLPTLRRYRVFWPLHGHENAQNRSTGGPFGPPAAQYRPKPCRWRVRHPPYIRA